MTTQEILVGATAALAGGYLATTLWRSWRGGCASGGCGKGCAPSATAGPRLIGADELLTRLRRRGSGEERP